jgi:hypothetical protein
MFAMIKVANDNWEGFNSHPCEKNNFPHREKKIVEKWIDRGKAMEPIEQSSLYIQFARYGISSNDVKFTFEANYYQQLKIRVKTLLPSYFIFFKHIL